ncbi:hypothetical protein Bpfe_003368 [Biomphalaria pfeifferi]|uniref:Uncharacterized protein n=1 Tax=Biomphalaria pfeifferi TaxID=112525 RepID=A0AAD8C6N5_BIOPF|nr:hypothetical protein Bpfe_003368 [Biomphalaria pfeifferi]
METRSNDNVYLIKSYVPEILGAKLPSYYQTFGYFLHLHKVEKMTVRKASKLTINVIMEFWKKASIQKLESVFYEWKGLQKHKSRSGEAHKKQEHEFVSHLEDLFDIAHQDALTIISNPEDRAFLLRQREKGRPGSIGVRDKVTERKARAAGERKQAEARRRQKSVDEMNIRS